MVKILLVEDDRATGAAIAGALTSHHHSVSLAVDGQTGLELAQQFEYDLMILDIVIPNLDGISLCRRIRSEGYENPILLLTANDSTTDRVIGLDAGADDYVIKPFDIEELMARVRALLRRGKALSSSIIKWENICFDLVNNQVTCRDRIIHLTPKEYCLLELFFLNPKRIFSRSAILDRLWDFAESPGEETVSTHIKCLRQKLKAAGASDPIETIHGLGYRLRLPEPDENKDKGKQDKFSFSSHLKKPKVPVYPSTKAEERKEEYRQKVAANTAKVWENFKDKFIDRVRVLEEALNALAADNLTAQLQQQAKQEAHKLAGSLGIFGIMKGSEIARQLEDLFQPQIILDISQVPQISKLVKQLLQELDKSPHVEGSKTSNEPSILIVDDNLILAERIGVEALAWGFRVELATDLNVARGAIAKSPPNVILLDLNLPGSENGLTLLKELMQRIPKIPVVAFTARGNLTNRLEVARLGGCVFLEKPLPTYEILKVVTDVLKQNQIQHHNRVLVVDDDPIILERFSTLLPPLGVEVSVLEQAPQFWDKLTAVTPNLVILDLEMPLINGIELCQTLRSDPKWYNLPVIFFSAHPEIDAIDRAFTAGADDYICKSVQETELVTRIIHRLRRVGFQNEITIHNS